MRAENPDDLPQIPPLARRQHLTPLENPLHNPAYRRGV
jgi:hypothetical protein